MAGIKNQSPEQAQLAAVEAVLSEAGVEAARKKAARETSRKQVESAEADHASAVAAHQRRPTSVNRAAVEQAHGLLVQAREQHRIADAAHARALDGVRVGERALREAHADAREAELPALRQAAWLETFDAVTAPQFQKINRLLKETREACHAIDAAYDGAARAWKELNARGEHVPKLDRIHRFGGLLRGHVESNPASAVAIISGLEHVHQAFDDLRGTTLEEKLLAAIDFDAHTNRGLSASASPEEIAAARADLEIILTTPTAHEAQQKRKQAKLARGSAAPATARVR